MAACGAVRDGGLTLRSLSRAAPGRACLRPSAPAAAAPPRSRCSRLGDQRAVVMVPGVEAGQEESEPGAEDLAQHAGPHPGEPEHPRPGARAGDPVLARAARACPCVRSTTKLRVTNSITFALTFQRLPARPVAGRVQPGVVGDALMLDLLDRVPAPQRRALGIGACRDGADCSSSWWARIAVKCSRHMVAARLTIGGRARVIDEPPFDPLLERATGRSPPRARAC